MSDSTPASRPATITWAHWDRMTRVERIAYAKVYLIDAVEHQHPDSTSISMKVAEGYSLLRKALAGG